MITTGSDFSGVGAFEQALERLDVKHERIFACDLDKHARDTYILNNGTPLYFPHDVNEREIPARSLSLYMSSPPCQGFSIAGMREGSILFLNSLNFIKENEPRYFIFENVSGLLSHQRINPTAEHGQTFKTWLNFLGGKSVNGLPVLFPYPESVPYHIYYKVMNAKHYGIPQNRERVFIVGIKNDADNIFSFPNRRPLLSCVRDVLEPEVADKYYLSQTLINWILKHRAKRESSNKFPMDLNREAQCITARYFKTGAEDGYIQDERGIRRHTPRECFRLMDFKESFKWNVSDTQAYKQAGNSITVGLLAEIINNLKLN